MPTDDLDFLDGRGSHLDCCKGPCVWTKAKKVWCGVSIITVLALAAGLATMLVVFHQSKDKGSPNYLAIGGSMSVINWGIGDYVMSSWNKGDRTPTVNLMLKYKNNFCLGVNRTITPYFKQHNSTSSDPWPSYLKCNITKVYTQPHSSGLHITFNMSFSKVSDWMKTDENAFYHVIGMALYDELTGNNTGDSTVFAMLNMDIEPNSVFFDDDVNHCANAHCAQTCKRLPWDFKCMCRPGYRSVDAKSCADIDECEEGLTNCTGLHAKCINTIGDFYCGCNPPYVLVGHRCRVDCKSGYIATDNDTCQDIDECAESPNICVHGTCNNQNGSYLCDCDTGYTVRHYGNKPTCTDENECDHNPCEAPTPTCINTQGSYKCVSQTPCYGHRQPDGSCTDCPSPYDRQCKDRKKCISALIWCDGSGQCDDVSDVIDCIVGCKKNQFRCDLKLHCVANKHWYDGEYYNCIDKSDEHQSNNPYGDTDFSSYDWLDTIGHSNSWSCKEDFRKCSDYYQCVHRSYFCDGIDDCKDSSDESSCGYHKTNTFTCDGYRTMARRKRCDGHKDCNDGTDEPADCQCFANEFKCDNGHCVEDSDRCNGDDECGDSSDEDNCDIDCTYGGHLCGGRCILKSQVCDGFINCDDRSDETNCDCSKDFRFQCSNGACIRSVFVCNGFDDCTDGSDELGCDYCERDGHFLCPSDGSCVPGFAVCDGEKDCPQGEDERNCSCVDQFSCSNGACISLNDVCDGKNDCSDGLEELHCARLDVNGTSKGSVFVLQYHGSWYPVCADDLPDRIGMDVCNELGLGDDGTMTSLPLPSKWTGVVHSSGWVKVVSGGYSDMVSLMENFEHVLSCPSKNAAFITCNGGSQPDDIACGTRSPHLNDEVVALIIGGKEAEEGKWPWQVQLNYKHQFTCGGSIISDRWIVTAGHCVESSKNATDYTIKLGTINRLEDGGTSKTYSIERVIQHEAFNNVTIQNDITLMKTTTPIEYTDYIRPVCLPRAQQDQSSQRRCYITGWGTSTYFGATSNTLREMRVNILKEHVCEDFIQSTDLTGEMPHVVGDQMLCLGYELADSCYGDSGGPMVCRQPDNTWTLIGLDSWGPEPYCQTYQLFTNLTTYIPWVKHHTGLTFQ